MDPQTLITGMAARAAELTAPPPKLQFRDLRVCNAANAKLEDQLGVSHARPARTLFEGNSRAVQLQELIARGVPSFSPAAIMPSSSATTRKLGLLELTKINEFVFGHAATAATLHNLTAKASADELSNLEAARAEHERVGGFYGNSSPALRAASNNLNLAHEAIRARQAGSDADKFLRLSQALLDEGLHVPGLTSRGRTVSLRGEKMSAVDRAYAQENIQAFLALTSEQPDLSELAQQNPVAAAARECLEATGRLDQFGRLTLQ